MPGFVGDIVRRVRLVLRALFRPAALLAVDPAPEAVPAAGEGTDPPPLAEALAVALEARDATAQDLRARRELLATLSHEVRTPLGGVVGLAELLADTELTPLQREYLRGIQAQSVALQGLVEEILDVSSLQAGHLEFERLDFSPETVLEEVLELESEAARRKGLALRARVDADVPLSVSGDPHRVRQVLHTLVANAVRCTERGGVAVHLGLAGGDAADGGAGCVLAFEVRDTGVGIAEADQATLFEGSDAAPDAAGRRGGLGLGLAISHGVLALLGGRLDLVRSRPGEGSTFRFTVPVVQRGGARVEDYDQRLLDGVQALVVDDNATNRVILQRHLAGAGARVQCAGSGTEALEALRAGFRPDVVMLDQLMPGMDGIEVAWRIRQLPAGSGLPIVMISSHSQLGLAESARSAGIARYLTRPVRRAQVLRCVVSLLHPRGAEEAEAGARVQARPVLVAEDNAINKRVIELFLEKAGLKADIVSSGRDAVEALRTDWGRYSLVLMDCHMPEMDGFEATSRIRDLGITLPIVALTADVRQGTRERCLEAGMDDYLTKPLKVDELQAVLARWGARRGA